MQIKLRRLNTAVTIKKNQIEKTGSSTGLVIIWETGRCELEGQRQNHCKPHHIPNCESS